MITRLVRDRRRLCESLVAGGMRSGGDAARALSRMYNNESTLAVRTQKAALRHMVNFFRERAEPGGEGTGPLSSIAPHHDLSSGLTNIPIVCHINCYSNDGSQQPVSDKYARSKSR
jgi:hypothetical protein